MNSTRFSRRVAVGLGTLLLLTGLGIAIGQGPPTENKGVTFSKSTSIELAGQINSVEGRVLRLRVVTVEPGGVIGQHSHRDRPAVAYVIRGALTEHREDGTVSMHRAGESWAVASEITHWEENQGSEPLVLVAADLFKQGTGMNPTR